MKRPTGVTIVAGYSFLWAPALAWQSASSFKDMASWDPMQSRGAGLMGTILLVFAVFPLVIGIGLLRLRETARLWAVALAALCLAFSLLFGLLNGLPALKSSMQSTQPLTSADFEVLLIPLLAALSGGTIWYLQKRDVRKCFGVT